SSAYFVYFFYVLHRLSSTLFPYTTLFRSAEQAEGMAVCALNDPAIEARINALEERKIPCVTFNSDLPGSRRLCFVGQEMNKAGRIAGELMSRCVPQDGIVLAAVGNL